MKMILFALGAMLLCTSANVFAQSTETDCPATTGAYYRVAGVWQPMDPVRSMGFKSTGVAKAAFSYGAAKMKLKAQFRDPRSPYQLREGSLSICLVGLTDNGRDITVAKLQKEKDRRELQLASIGTWSGVNAQIDPKLVVPITMSKLAEKTFLISSVQPMVDGEFILFTIVPDIASMAKANTPQSLAGYDFGSHTD
jgi:hypothetical protein